MNSFADLFLHMAQNTNDSRKLSINHYIILIRKVGIGKKCTE